jgi:glucose/arabinose dehydrogenase
VGHRMRRLPAGLAALATLAVAAGGGAAPAGAVVGLVSVGTFERPTYVTAPPGDAQRVVVVEQGGRVRLIKDGARQAGAFLDVSALSTTLPAGYSERGLFSVAFAPDYASSGLLYAYYTAKANGNLRIDEFRRGADPDRIDTATRRPVLEIPHDQQGNHNGGQLQFGPDGMLYAGTGDGGSAYDPADNGQNLTRTSPAVVGGVNQSPLLGKILRIDPRAGTPYAVPAGNPFGEPAREVWALGLRNPYRFSFDRDTGDLIIGDVGQNRYEEITFAAAGGEAPGRGTNFGWKLYEGLHTAAGAPIGSPPAGYAFPAIEHPHAAGWCSLTGGYVVRDPALGELAGQYVYGDYCLGRVYAARLTAGGASNVRALDLPVISELSSFGEDACARVYVTSLTGPVSRLSDGGQCILRTREPGTPAPAGPAGPGPAVPGGGSRDTRAPRALLYVAGRQRVLRTGFVTVRVRCDEQCSVRANGRVVIRRLRSRRSAARAAADRPLRVRTGRATVAAGASVAVRLRIARSTRARIDGALKRPRRTATAVITVRATDRAGNTSTRRVSVRIVRRLARR